MFQIGFGFYRQYVFLFIKQWTIVMENKPEKQTQVHRWECFLIMDVTLLSLGWFAYHS